MYMAEVPRSHPFVFLLLGVQYHGHTPSATTTATISQLETLLKDSAVHIESLEQSGPIPSLGRSRVWLTYWTSPASHDEWWTSAPVQTFWNALPDNAGVWREKLTLPMSRVQLGTNVTSPSGFAHLGKLVPNTTKSGYWGCYRDRIEECTETERLESSLGAFPERGEVKGEVRSGRVRMERFPENICVVVEGQDNSAMESEEREHWMERFDGPARKWIGDVVGAGEEGGVLASMLCCRPESGLLSGESGKKEGGFDTLDYNRKVQVLYFLDMGYMERIGKKNRGHVKLRGSFMESYCPAGPMANGKQLMWVEQGVLKSKDIEAEYIGCYDGTGFMAFEGKPGFVVDEKTGDDGSWSRYLKNLLGWAKSSA
ncbi:heme-containing dehydratase protein [Leptodontidium sp. MPI-SDFR-AT-0119]|nr:heme-containing dehydratase protein [Leptodontidium sp. MPI-SDFR-AT-0119]